VRSCCAPEVFRHVTPQGFRVQHTGACWLHAQQTICMLQPAEASKEVNASAVCQSMPGHAGAGSANSGHAQQTEPQDASLLAGVLCGEVFHRLFEIRKFEVRVDFGGVQITMAQELLHVTNAGAATQKMSRAAVTKGVDAGFEFNLKSVVTDTVGDHLIRETMARN